MLNQNRRHHADHPLDERVAALLAAAAAPTETGPAPGEEEALAAFRASQQTTGRSLLRSPITPAKTALAAAVGAGVLLTGGVAAAATGSLPGAAQDKASEMLTKVGVTVPGADEHSAGNADQRGSSADDAEETESTDETEETTEESTTEDAVEAPAVEDDGSEDTESHGKGEVVRELAKSDETSGVEKGAAVSGYASEGNSKAGENHQQGKPAEDDADDADETTEGDDADEPSAGETKSAEQKTDGETKSAEKRHTDDGSEDTDAED